MQHLVSIEDARSTTPTQKNTPLLPRETRVLGGRYRVLRLIGRGGMADVFLGDDLLLERAVAIKILHTHLADDSSGLERFRREAMTLAAVRSPHVVGIYDIGLDAEGVFLVMQHLEGHTIEEEIARTGPMSGVRAASVLTQLLDGLAEVHSLGLVHRDIKPSNVILGAGDHVVLLDLGIALDPRRTPLTAPGMVAGTPGYLAPESRTRAESDYASDVYQVGLLMLFLLTGVDFARRCPMKGVEDLLQRLPAPLCGITRRALANDPSKRFPSASVMRDALDVALGSPPTKNPKHQRPRTARGEQSPLVEVPSTRDLGIRDTTLAITAGDAVRVRNAKTTALQAAQILAVQSISDPPVDFDLRPTGPQLPIARISDTRGKPPLVADVSFDLRPTRALPRLTSNGEPQPTRPARILIVDEDVAFCRTLCRMLKPHDTTVVNTPAQALAHLEGGTPVDVILCGLTAPMKFHAALRETYPKQSSAIIFLTGRANKEARAFVASVTDRCLGKPFDLGLLRRLIDDCLAANERSGDRARSAHPT